MKGTFLCTLGLGLLCLAGFVLVASPLAAPVAIAGASTLILAIA
jgi:hypothetical protein